MNRARRCAIVALGFGLGATVASAQDVSRYRGYVLESTLASIVASSGARAADARTLHERPAKIQELQWRPPYASSVNVTATADPVRVIKFSFVDDALFQIIVDYDGARTAGLTNQDIVETLSATYGAPVSRSGKAQPVRPSAAYPDNLVVAQWESTAESLTLLRGTYDSAFQLILFSKALATRARQASRDAVRLDAAEAPRRESDRLQREAAEAAAAREKARTTNKGAFRP
jgi:hypothetical protein